MRALIRERGTLIREQGTGNREQQIYCAGALGFRSLPAFHGQTLVEVLMSIMVMGIGVLSVIVLFPLSFVRAVQATNLTNATILRYEAESQIDNSVTNPGINPRLLLRWQANWTYALGDTIVLTTAPPIALQCSVAGTSGPLPPTWNTGAVGATTVDNTATWVVPAANSYNNPQLPGLQANSNYPEAFVVDPLGWNAIGAGLQNSLGNNGGAVDPRGVARFNGEAANGLAAGTLVTLPDSWVEQARGPVTAFVAGTPGTPGTPGSATLTGPVDLSSVAVTAYGAAPPQQVTRIVLFDATGKNTETRIVTGPAPIPAGTTTVQWNANDPLLPNFTPVFARIETQELRYTYMLTVLPAAGGGTSNVTVTVFFHRTLTPTDEQVYQTTGTDGVVSPFQVQYGGLPAPFAKKGGFLFDCYFGRWYRITNVLQDPALANTLDVYVDQSRPTVDIVQPNTGTFGAVFMRGVVDFYPLLPH